MQKLYIITPYNKICNGCNISFFGHFNRLYCSQECRKKFHKSIRKTKHINDLNYFLDEKLKLTISRQKSKKNGRKLHKEVTITYTYLKELWIKQKGLCAISGIPMTYLRWNKQIPTNVSIDRIDSLKDYIEGNIQLACVQANYMKNNLNADQLLFWCNSIINTSKVDK